MLQFDMRRCRCMTHHCCAMRLFQGCEDHAVLLCGLLLGFGLDAYVCIGSKIKGGGRGRGRGKRTGGNTGARLGGDPWTLGRRHVLGESNGAEIPAHRVRPKPPSGGQPSPLAPPPLSHPRLHVQPPVLPGQLPTLGLRAHVLV